MFAIETFVTLSSAFSLAGFILFIISWVLWGAILVLNLLQFFMSRKKVENVVDDFESPPDNPSTPFPSSEPPPSSELPSVSPDPLLTETGNNL